MWHYWAVQSLFVSTYEWYNGRHPVFWKNLNIVFFTRWIYGEDVKMFNQSTARQTYSHRCSHVIQGQQCTVDMGPTWSQEVGSGPPHPHHWPSEHAVPQPSEGSEVCRECWEGRRLSSTERQESGEWHTVQELKSEQMREKISTDIWHESKIR